MSAGLTHAESVIPVVSRSAGESGTVTQSSRPSKFSAPPNRPAALRAAPVIVPGLPAAAVAVAPDASSKPHAPTRPVGVVQAGASATVKDTATVFVSPAPATVTVPV